MLGVATLIVVNSVMGGFSAKPRDRLHGLLSDVVLEAHDYHGFSHPELKMELIRSDPFLNARIEAMAPTLEIFAMLQHTYEPSQSPIVRPIRLIGIEPESRAQVGGFAEFLLLNKDRPRFELSEEAKRRYEARERMRPTPLPELWPGPGDKPPPAPPPRQEFVPECAIVGYALAHYRMKEPDAQGNLELRALQPGDDVIIATISGARIAPVHARFTVC